MNLLGTKMNDLLYMGVFISGCVSGFIIGMLWYGPTVHSMSQQNIDLIRKMRAMENKKANEREAEYFRRGGLYALQTMHDFTKHRLGIDPSKLELFDED